MLYPLKLRPIFKQRIWGGQKLSAMFDLPADDPIGEMWAVADHPNGRSVIANGPFRGRKFGEIFQNHCDNFLHNHVKSEGFPLLVKILDAAENLSVQVHPDNDYAARFEEDKGKAELWYIIEAGAEAEIVYGLKPGVTRRDLTRLIQSGNIEQSLNKIRVKAGDAIYIPPGLIHALGKGILAAEIQQSSDITYRIYDYGRLDGNGQPRKLHIDRALKVIDFDLNLTKTTLAEVFSCEHFVVDILELNNLSHSLSQMEVLLVLKGRATLQGEYGAHLKAGDSLVVPPGLELNLIGNIRVLRTRINR